MVVFKVQPFKGHVVIIVNKVIKFVGSSCARTVLFMLE
jgi:hypothetical protein